MTKRTLSTVMELKTERRNSAFTVRGVQFKVDLDPFLNIDLFEIAGPVFASHPHAGFSVATYLFDDSTTRIRNRDSLGDRSLTEPGGLHWTVAGSGIVHDEMVEEIGRIGHGAQIVVRLPASVEQDDPYGMHFTPNELPMVELGAGADLRVVAGEIDGARSPVREATNAHVYDLLLRPGSRVELPIDPTFRGFVMVVQGGARVEVADQVGDLGPEGLGLFEVGDDPVAIEAGSTGAQLLVGAGVPLRQSSYMLGGFCMSTEDRVRAAVERYRAGEMDGLLRAR
ncbi:MAG: pirin family protein [Pseudonocardiaceae bacterium]